MWRERYQAFVWSSILPGRWELNREARELNLSKQEMPPIQIKADYEDLMGKLEKSLGKQAGEMQMISDISEIQPRLDSMIADNKQVLGGLTSVGA